MNIVINYGLYSNIYLQSYNKDCQKDTESIYLFCDHLQKSSLGI